MTTRNTDCVVYRCSKQREMYLYVRADFKPDTLPDALLRKAGKLTQVMNLTLSPERKLARVDVTQVIQRLNADGYYLQMPPDGHIKAHLHFGD